MKTIEEIRDWILENCVDSDGDIIMSYLDFSDFDGDVYINHMKVKHSLLQYCHQVGEDLQQHRQVVGGGLDQYCQDVGGTFITHTPDDNKCFIPPMVKMTKAQIEEALGYKIKIVEE